MATIRKTSTKKRRTAAKPKRRTATKKRTINKKVGLRKNESSNAKEAYIDFSATINYTVWEGYLTSEEIEILKHPRKYKEQIGDVLSQFLMDEHIQDIDNFKLHNLTVKK